MVEVSKHLFDQKCRDVDCHILAHPWHQSCLTSSYHSYKSSLLGSAKFYFVIHMVQNLVRGRKTLTRKALMQMGEYYVRSTLLGMLISGTSVTFSCLLRRLMGNKFTYYSYFFLPNTLNGIFILLEPPSRRGLVINLFSSLFIEYWLRKWEKSGYFLITTAKITCIFMIGNAILLYLMRLEGEKKQRTPLLWLFTPETVRHTSKDTINVCPHTGLCWKYILKGSAAYFGVGVAISLARDILSKIRSPIKLLSCIRGSNFKLGLFFGSYIGIYRAVICYLCRKRGFDSAEYALPAGYLAGLSILFKPNLSFAVASLTGAFKLYATILYERKILPENLPLPIILYCLCQGTLFHARLMHPDVCPSYVFKLMNSVSNGRLEQLYSNLLTVVKSEV